MRNIPVALVVAACVVVPHWASAQSTYTFVRLAWGSSRADVRTVLVGKGYAFDSEDEDGDLHFKGSLSNEPTHIIALFEPGGQLVKVMVTLLTPDEDARHMYESTVGELAKMYGAPDVVLHKFDAPYVAGDGRDDAAIRDGKAHLTTCWTHGRKVSDGTGQDGLCATVNRNLTVGVIYESAGWDREADRRTGKAPKGP
jgi:hypothetical protein